MTEPDAALDGADGSVDYVTGQVSSGPPPSAPASLDAPWLEDPQRFITEELPAGAARPGWYCYLRETRTFTLVVQVSVLRSRTGPLALIDLADGRSLALSASSDEVLVRRPYA